MHSSFRSKSLVLILGWTAVSLMAANVQAQPTSVAQAPRYQQTFSQRTRLYDESCVVPQKRVYRKLEYRLCRMEDTLTRVSMEGPPTDNGPVAYFYGERLYAYRDTGRGEAWIFQNGKLVAEVEAGYGVFDGRAVKTKFTAKERTWITDRAIGSTRNMLRVFGLELRL